MRERRYLNKPLVVEKKMMTKGAQVMTTVPQRVR